MPLAGPHLLLPGGEFGGRTWQACWFTFVEGRAPTALAAGLDTSAAIRQARSRVLCRLRQETDDLLD